MISGFFQRECVYYGYFYTINWKISLKDHYWPHSSPLKVAIFCIFIKKWLFQTSILSQSFFQNVQISYYTIFDAQIFDSAHQNKHRLHILARKDDQNLNFSKNAKNGRPSPKIQRPTISKIMDFGENFFGTFIFLL